METRKPPTTFSLVLIKPSHYDDDGYVIQWYRSAIPANSLACLYGLAKECADDKILGDDVEIQIHAFDETNTTIKQTRIKKLISDADDGMVMLVGVQSNQFPRALDIARPLRDAGIKVAVGGFHVSGTMSMLKDRDPGVQKALDMGVSVFAGEAEGRLGEVLKDAFNGDLKPALQFHGRPAEYRGCRDAGAAGRAGSSHGRSDDQLRRRARMPVRLFVLHDHQCSGTKIPPPFAG